MKILFKISLIFSALSFLFLLGCKKYPDGPLASIYTKKHRLVGEWEVDYFAINGYDSTSYVRSLPYFGKIGFYKTEDSHGRCTFSYFSNNYDYKTFGYWEFKNNKNDIYIHQVSLNPPINFSIGPYGAGDATWDIMRLKDKELWLKSNYDGKEYFIKFKQ